jgi:hypothetical protein
MKLHVVVDGQGNVMGAVAKGVRSAEGEEVVIRPAHDDHRLHEVEVSENSLKLPAEEFHKYLKGRLAKR